MEKAGNTIIAKSVAAIAAVIALLGLIIVVLLLFVSLGRLPSMLWPAFAVVGGATNLVFSVEVMLDQRSSRDLVKVLGISLAIVALLALLQEIIL